MPKTSAKYLIEKEKNDDEFKRQGFEWAGWNAWRYTWQGDFPIFTVKPGTVNGSNGIVAAVDLPSDVEVWFPYGTPAGDIRTRLDNEILAIMRMRHDADIDGPPLDWKPEGARIDIDHFMAVAE